MRETSMRTGSRRRRGLALAVTVSAMATVGALIAGVFFSSTQEYRVGRNSVLQARALTAAEYGLNAILSAGEWSPLWSSAPSAGPLATRAYLPGDGSVDTVRVYRLARGNFLIVSEGRSAPSLGARARRRIGALVTLRLPALDSAAALTARDSVSVQPGALVTGVDALPPGWTCPPAGADVASVTAGDTSYAGLSAADRATLVAAAQSAILAGASIAGPAPALDHDGKCDLSAPLNWGDPLLVLAAGAELPCRDYFPVIHAPGDLHITGGAGQGILLVDGDLTIDGGFQFFGLVLVRGALVTTGSAAHVVGAVVAARASLASATVVRYSRCALSRALLGAATPVFARAHAWVDMY
jgi:hypothetical protein